MAEDYVIPEPEPKEIDEKLSMELRILSSNAVLKGTKVKGVLDTWNDDWNLSFSSPG